jgi:chaperone modulatory protein CbpM
MTLKKPEFLARAELSQETLDVWIEEEWLLPGGESAELEFSDVDVARALLIRDLMRDLGVNREGVGIILGLLDQMHGMRRALRSVLQSSGHSSAFKPDQD